MEKEILRLEEQNTSYKEHILFLENTILPDWKSRINKLEAELEEVKKENKK